LYINALRDPIKEQLLFRVPADTLAGVIEQTEHIEASLQLRQKMDKDRRRPVANTAPQVAPSRGFYPAAYSIRQSPYDKTPTQQSANATTKSLIADRDELRAQNTQLWEQNTAILKRLDEHEERQHAENTGGRHEEGRNRPFRDY
jgi:hypothetical protein